MLKQENVQYELKQHNLQYNSNKIWNCKEVLCWTQIYQIFQRLELFTAFWKSMKFIIMYLILSILGEIFKQSDYFYSPQTYPLLISGLKFIEKQTSILSLTVLCFCCLKSLNQWQNKTRLKTLQSKLPHLTQMLS